MNAPDALRMRHVRVVAAVVVALLALPVVARIAWLERVVGRIVRRGGLVTSDAGVFSDDARVLGRAPRWLQQAFILRDGYDVSFGTVRPSCTRGQTLTRWSDRTADATDADVALARDLGRMQSLTLIDTHVGDEGLVHLEGLGRLKALDLANTRVAGPGLAHLRGLPLELLVLSDTAVDDGLANLDESPKLKQLTLARTRVRGPGLAPVARFPGLSHLELDSTPIDDDGLRYLAGLPIEDLGISSTAVSDAGLAHLDALPKLSRVWASCSRVTAAGAEHLKKTKRIDVEWRAVNCPRGR
jgi:hypothetical protein